MHNESNFTAMILAAGYGTRLRPITDEIPKPLIPVGDRTLLENILINLHNAGVARFAINTHHLPDMISDSIEQSSWKEQITLFKEDEILGTGGPLVNAKKILSSGDGFILHNGDILTDINLLQLVAAHTEDSSSLVTMVMIDGPENKVAVDSNNKIVDILGKLGKEENHQLLTYAGIACFSTEIFDYLPEKPQNCSIITAILKLMREKPDSVAAFLPQNHSIDKQIQPFWNDLGTVEKFVEVHKKIAGRQLLLPDLSEKKMISMPMHQLPHQGSGRIFFRIHGNSCKSRIVMCSSDDNADFERFISIGNFLNAQKLGSAEIFNINMCNHTVIMEDLGDDTLYKLVKQSDEDEIEALYRQVIEWLIRFQTSSVDKISPEEINDNENLLKIRTFDYNYLRWETDYFRDNFLKGYCKLNKSEIVLLDSEFHRLANECLSHPQLMIHRDFQSQNILFKNSEVRIVDFQGARIGHIAYDLMSLVNDPYVYLSKKLRNSLIAYYFELLNESGLATVCFDPHCAHKKLWNADSLTNAAALQRNMQALGAYAFLSGEKGKKEYIRFIPRGVELLKEVVEESREKYPKLEKIVRKILTCTY